jgi:small conductance mechanosensitive channel
MNEITDAVWRPLLEWSPRLLAALIVIIASWLAGQLMQRIIGRLQQRIEPQHHNLLRLIQQIGFILIMVAGIITALSTLGVNVTALIASLGLVGFALGFALKDALSNLIAGIMILLYRPFSLGDTIAVGGQEGEVIAIDLRYTALAGKGRTLFIPNSKLFSENVAIIHPTLPTPGDPQ